MNSSVAVIVALIGILVAPLVTYIIATRRLSGKIRTSEAADLWAESAAMRHDYQTENERLRGRVTDLEGRAAIIEAINNDLTRDLRLSQDEIKRLDTEISALKKENNELKKENKVLLVRIGVLEKAVLVAVEAKEKAEGKIDA